MSVDTLRLNITVTTLMEFWIMANLVNVFKKVICRGQTIQVVKTLYVLIAMLTMLNYKKVFGLMILSPTILGEL